MCSSDLWCRRVMGDRRVTDEVIREGLEAFFREHSYLDHVRLRPIPHEGFHANAGYFSEGSTLLQVEGMRLLVMRVCVHQTARGNVVGARRIHSSARNMAAEEACAARLPRPRRCTSARRGRLRACSGGLHSRSPAAARQPRPRDGRTGGDAACGCHDRGTATTAARATQLL